MIARLGVALSVIWAATLIGAVAGRIGGSSSETPRDALPATVTTFSDLLAHNAPVALWPCALVAIGWPFLRGVRHVGDTLVAAQLLSHGLLIGVALGTHAELWRYLPHLPLEWLALALPAAAWLQARTGPAGTPRGIGLCAFGSVAALVSAAAVETFLVPMG